MANETGKITIISEDLAPSRDGTDRITRSGGDDSTVQKISRKVTSVTADALKANFDSTTSTIGTVVNAAFEKSFGDLKVDSLEVNLQVEADGTIGILGSGVAVKGSASLKLVFKHA